MSDQSRGTEKTQVKPLAIDDLSAIRKGIAPYEEERVRITAFLDGWKSQWEFNGEFSGILGSFPTHGMSGDALILGGMSGYGTTQWWIHLLQLMVVIGDVNQKEEDGIQFYQAHTPVRPPAGPGATSGSEI